MKKKTFKSTKIALNKKKISNLNNHHLNIKGGSGFLCGTEPEVCLAFTINCKSRGCPTSIDTDGHSNGPECPDGLTIVIIF